MTAATIPAQTDWHVELGAWAERRKRYNVVRSYFKGGRRTILFNLSLAEAQAHCSDPETSSSTCTSAVGKRRTRQMGEWFDGYEEVR